MRDGRRNSAGAPGLALGLAVTLLVLAGLAGAKGKPSKPPPEPTGPEYTLIDLGDLGGDGSKAWRVNEAGQVVGGAFNADGVWCPFLVTPEDTDSDGKPDRWFRDDDSDGINDLMVFLGLLGGDAAVKGVARDVNDHGVVVGTAWVEDPDAYAGTIAHTWVWNAGEMIDLGTLEAGTNPTATNNRGQIVGSIRSPDGPGTPMHSYLITPEDSDGDGEPDLWFKDSDGDGWNDLQLDLGANFGERDINDTGEVLGRACVLVPEDTDGDGAADNWWRDDDGDGVNDLLVELPALEGGQVSDAQCVNSAGQVAGACMTGGKFSLMHAVRWETDLTPTDLGAPGRRATSKGVALNDDGDVVGESDRRGMLWQDGGMYELLDLLTNPEGIDYVSPQDITNSGLIVGYTNRGGFIAVPTGN